jgi:hypothetical protein
VVTWGASQEAAAKLSPDGSPDILGQPVFLKGRDTVVQRLALLLENNLVGCAVKRFKRQLRRVLGVYFLQGASEHSPHGLKVDRLIRSVEILEADEMPN